MALSELLLCSVQKHTPKIPEVEKIEDRNKVATARNATGESRQSCPAGTRVVEPLRMNTEG